MRMITKLLIPRTLMMNLSENHQSKNKYQALQIPVSRRQREIVQDRLLFPKTGRKKCLKNRGTRWKRRKLMNLSRKMAK